MKHILMGIILLVLASPVFAYGTVTVSSNIDGASVYLNGQYQGQTPLTLMDYPSRDYVIKVNMHGYSEYEREFTLSQGATVKLHAELERVQPITVTQDVFYKIDSKPAGAKVYINGEYAGMTPLYINERKVRSKEVYIVKDGYQGYYQRFESNSSSTCSINLVPASPQTHYVHSAAAPVNEKKYEQPGSGRNHIRNILLGAELLNEVITPHEKHKRENRGAILGGIFLNEVFNNK